MWPFALTFPELSPNDVGSESTLSDDSIGHGVYDYIIRGGQSHFSRYVEVRLLNYHPV